MNHEKEEPVVLGAEFVVRALICMFIAFINHVIMSGSDNLRRYTRNRVAEPFKLASQLLEEERNRVEAKNKLDSAI
jgi:hypothetical protein